MVPDFVIFPVLPIVLLIACAAVVYWALSQMAPLGTTPRLRVPPPVRPSLAADSAALQTMLAAPPAAAPAAVAPAAVADDLTIVEGIGPKIASVLRAGGIPNLSALAAAEPSHIQQILSAAGMNLAAPATWPEQARLAVSGRSAELKALQDSLRAGRRA